MGALRRVGNVCGHQVSASFPLTWAHARNRCHCYFCCAENPRLDTETPVFPQEGITAGSLQTCPIPCVCVTFACVCCIITSPVLHSHTT